VEIHADVAIIGAGPVGMTLALALGRRGHDVVIVEQRSAGMPPPVKANHVSARSMELFRRLGVSRAVRSAGLPADFPHDIVFRTSFTGPEFGRIRIPCARDRFTDTSGPDGSWPTPEPAHRINQIFLEPVLMAAVRDSPSLQVLFDTIAESVTQESSHATVVARSVTSDAELRIRADYVVGCEGGSSLVRHTIGASFTGDAVVQCTQSTYVDAPELLGRLQSGPAWGNFAFNRERSGMVYAIDGVRRWLVHNYLRPDETFEQVDRNAGLRSILGLSSLDGITIVSAEDWTGRRMLADRFRSGRLFICGDAAHIWVPFAGYGMNAGLADAESLAWCLSASLRGWGGPRVLDAYEIERMPITEQVSKMAMAKAVEVASDRQVVPLGLDDPGEAGERARREFGERIYERNVEQYCAAGLNFGYFYVNSPIIVPDGEDPPAYTMGRYQPCAIPGARFPHVWMDEAHTRSLYDELGTGLTLLDAGSPYAMDVEVAAKKMHLPLTVLVLPDSVRGEAWLEHELYLVRDDTHVVWRGSGRPRNIEGALRRVSGWS